MMNVACYSDVLRLGRHRQRHDDNHHVSAPYDDKEIHRRQTDRPRDGEMCSNRLNDDNNYVSAPHDDSYEL